MQARHALSGTRGRPPSGLGVRDEGFDSFPQLVRYQRLAMGPPDVAIGQKLGQALIPRLTSHVPSLRSDGTEMASLVGRPASDAVAMTSLGIGLSSHALGAKVARKPGHLGRNRRDVARGASHAGRNGDDVAHSCVLSNEMGDDVARCPPSAGRNGDDVLPSLDSVHRSPDVVRRSRSPVRSRRGPVACLPDGAACAHASGISNIGKRRAHAAPEDHDGHTRARARWRSVLRGRPHNSPVTNGAIGVTVVSRAQAPEVPPSPSPNRTRLPVDLGGLPSVSQSLVAATRSDSLVGRGSLFCGHPG